MADTGIFPPHEPDGEGLDAFHVKVVEPLVIDEPKVCVSEPVTVYVIVGHVGPPALGTLTVPETEYVPTDGGVVFDVRVQAAPPLSVQVPAQCAHGTGFGEHGGALHPGSSANAATAVKINATITCVVKCYLHA